MGGVYRSPLVEGGQPVRLPDGAALEGGVDAHDGPQTVLHDLIQELAGGQLQGLPQDAESVVVVSPRPGGSGGGVHVAAPGPEAAADILPGPGGLPAEHLQGGGMGEEAADRDRNVRMGGIFCRNLPIGPDALIQIDNPFLPQDHGGHAHGNLGERGGPDFVVRRHGNGIPQSPSAGKGICYNAVLHYGHLHPHGAVFRRNGLHFLLNLPVMRPAGALRLMYFQTLRKGPGQWFPVHIGRIGRQHLGQLSPGHRQLRMNGV